ncbi:MAG: FAD-binding oxidoreductase [Candidatus Cardinium sp.]|uniref:FAD-binding oxidoreductase n=1 Tax=Candidatus Cardinium sp. TP TaxID=2961955 RepID=UPI0021AF7117|nr:FAD-binding oxidoreductase [Candidatus Cardinium sp. TP]MCT4696976.1 FAD-binding oxidoreductase [Candidatus Cardinium sp. TP]MDN5247007.1 FAD-binding oxidoreductase [Candidatus Cardinium sp.]
MWSLIDHAQADIAVMELNQFKVKHIGSTMLTPSVAELTFIRSDQLPFGFIPGQFITFLLPHASGKTIPRSYSLANSPGDRLDIAIAPVAGGFATNILFNLKIGDELRCVGPRGRLILQTVESPSQYILVATGTGVAPYRSMLPALAQRLEADDKLKVTLLLGVRYANDLLYAEDFIAFAQKYERFHFRGYLSRADVLTTPYHYAGYVQSAFETLDLNPMTDLVYLCGNPYMIDDSIEKLETMGFNPQRIKREKYISRGV